MRSKYQARVERIPAFHAGSIKVFLGTKRSETAIKNMVAGRKRGRGQV